MISRARENRVRSWWNLPRFMDVVWPDPDPSVKKKKRSWPPCGLAADWCLLQAVEVRASDWTLWLRWASVMKPSETQGSVGSRMDCWMLRCSGSMLRVWWLYFHIFPTMHVDICRQAKLAEGFIISTYLTHSWTNSWKFIGLFLSAYAMAWMSPKLLMLYPIPVFPCVWPFIVSNLPVSSSANLRRGNLHHKKNIEKTYLLSSLPFFGASQHHTEPNPSLSRSIIQPSSKTRGRVCVSK